MKGKLLLLGMAALTLISCNDDLKLIGPSIQPDGDKPVVQIDSFQLTAETIQIDKIYAKTIYGLLGKLDDPLFGTLKSDYLCQFYCPENFQFKYKPNFGVIDSVDLTISYGTSFGDTLAPMQAKVYMITKPLNKDFYTDVDPKEYCDMKQLMGSVVYSAFDPNIPDSIRNLQGFFPSVRIPFPKAFGQEFYETSVNEKHHFVNQETFNSYFPGLYITTTSGQGCILEVSLTVINFYYRHVVNEVNKEGRDTTYIANAVERFVVTPEVIQLNQFDNTKMEGLIGVHPRINYQKTPAGVFTQINIPVKDIADKTDGFILNTMPLSVQILPPDDDPFSLTQEKTPTYGLLLPADSIDLFFKNKQIENNQTSFLSAAYSTSYRTYYFGNISGLIKDRIQYAKDNNVAVEDTMRMVIVPVNRVSAQNSYTNTYYTTSLTNYLAPSGAKLITDPKSLKIQIVSSKYPKADSK